MKHTNSLMVFMVFPPETFVCNEMKRDLKGIALDDRDGHQNGKAKIDHRYLFHWTILLQELKWQK